MKRWLLVLVAAAAVVAGCEGKSYSIPQAKAVGIVWGSDVVVFRADGRLTDGLMDDLFITESSWGEKHACEIHVCSPAKAPDVLDKWRQQRLSAGERTIRFALLPGTLDELEKAFPDKTRMDGLRSLSEWSQMCADQTDGAYVVVIVVSPADADQVRELLKGEGFEDDTAQLPDRTIEAVNSMFDGWPFSNGEKLTAGKARQAMVAMITAMGEGEPTWATLDAVKTPPAKWMDDGRFMLGPWKCDPKTLKFSCVLETPPATYLIDGDFVRNDDCTWKAVVTRRGELWPLPDAKRSQPED